VIRAVIIKESLKAGTLPPDLSGTPTREYQHLLDADTTVTIIELTVAEQHALEVGMALSRALLPRLYYAHLINEGSMYIAFPNCVVHLERGDADGQRQAQAIGQTFEIPLSQMRFLEMFDMDHPDAPVRADQ
jgi:hypothetical protein